MKKTQNNQKTSNFKEAYSSLSEEQKAKFAITANYNREYIETQMMYAYKCPKPERMRDLYNAFNGAITWESLIWHFYGKIITESVGGGDLVMSIRDRSSIKNRRKT